MTWPVGNEIVIDTNVFKHLCDRDAKFNPDGHCSVLLAGLAMRNCVLLIDDAGLFLHEFNAIVKPQFERESEIAGEIAILRYWADPGNYAAKEIDEHKQLMAAIKTVIVENERADRAFVYLAFRNGRALVTNDESHIVIWPVKKKEKGGERRVRLLKACKAYISQGAEILFSFEACNCFGGANA